MRSPCSAAAYAGGARGRGDTPPHSNDVVLFASDGGGGGGGGSPVRLEPRNELLLEKASTGIAAGSGGDDPRFVR